MGTAGVIEAFEVLDVVGLVVTRDVTFVVDARDVIVVVGARDATDVDNMLAVLSKCL